jgi:hypothetical protein
MLNVSIREYFLVLNVFIVCICNTARSKSIPLLCTHVDSYKFSTVHPPSILSYIAIFDAYELHLGDENVFNDYIDVLLIIDENSHNS